MNEEFCFWSFSRWKSVLGETGFRVIENPNQPNAGSRAYGSPWIVQHRYENHVALHGDDGARLPWPPTNMVLVAEKPRL